jgi:serine/threonine protein kinase
VCCEGITLQAHSLLHGLVTANNGVLKMQAAAVVAVVQVWALKSMTKEAMVHKNQVGHVQAERDVLASADNNWIVGLQYSFQDDINLYMVMEFLPGGDLMSLLMKVRAAKLYCYVVIAKSFDCIAHYIAAASSVQKMSKAAYLLWSVQRCLIHSRSSIYAKFKLLTTASTIKFVVSNAVFITVCALHRSALFCRRTPSLRQPPSSTWQR